MLLLIWFVYYDGIIFHSQLERVNDDIFLANHGWKKSFDYHNLEGVYFVMFEYIGNSTFIVSIFDHSVVEATNKSDFCEIEFSPTRNPIFRIKLSENC